MPATFQAPPRAAALPYPDPPPRPGAFKASPKVHTKRIQNAYKIANVISLVILLQPLTTLAQQSVCIFLLPILVSYPRACCGRRILRSYSAKTGRTLFLLPGGLRRRSLSGAATVQNSLR